MLKRIIFYVFLLVSNVCFGQNDTLIYNNNKIDNKNSIRSIILMPNKEFVYGYEGLSCRIFYDEEVTGTWEKNNDKIVLTYKSNQEIQNENKYKAKDFIVLVLKDKNGKPLSNVEINCFLSFKNWSPKKNRRKFSLLSDEQGKVVFHVHQEYDKKRVICIINFGKKQLKINVENNQNYVEITAKNTEEKGFSISKSFSNEILPLEKTLFIHNTYLVKGDKLLYKNTVFSGIYDWHFSSSDDKREVFERVYK